MNIELQCCELAGLPRPEGAHQLAWSYVLDMVFADAYHAGIQDLMITIPHPQLVPDVMSRRLFTKEQTGHQQRAAFMVNTPIGLHDIDRLYSLRFGLLAPPFLRQMSTPLATPWKHLESLSVYTLRAKLWGAGMILSHKLNCPAMYDPCSFAMRRYFSQAGRAAAFYHLDVWERE